MRLSVAGVTRALGLALLAGAATAQAQVQISVSDARIPEGNGGTFSPRLFSVHTSGPPPVAVNVNWQLVAGSAKALAGPPDNDFIMASGTLTFPALGDATEEISVQINGDLLDEWSPTDKQDQIFFIQLSNPVNGTIQKGHATILLVDDDDGNLPGLQHVAAATRNAVPGEVKLHWRVPAPKPDDVLVRWNQGGSCSPPIDHLVAVTGGEFYLSSIPAVVNPIGAAQTVSHIGRPLGVKHCYSLFSVFAGTPTPTVQSINVTPLGAGQVRWAYHTGSPGIVPPTVGMDAIYTVDQSGVVHAMLRADSGGFWPSTWNPVGLGKPAQTRSPVVPFPEGWRLFVGTDEGGVHSVDGRDGRLLWSRSTAFGNALPSGPGRVQAPPAVLLSGFGGSNDMVLVGTNATAGNLYFALDPKTGNTQDTLAVTMGDVKGMAVVDYLGNRAFFLNSSPSLTLHAVSLGPAGTPDLTSAALPGGNPWALGAGSSSSPVMRGDRIYLGDSSNPVYALNLLDGTTYDFDNGGDGQVKGFPWPDRRNMNLYYSTNNKIHGIRDDGGAFSTLPWSPITNSTHASIRSPSILLQKPGTDLLYVGNDNGQLIQIDVSGGTPMVSTLPLEGPGVQIGAPSLDGQHGLVIVGSATGAIYAVRVPF